MNYINVIVFLFMIYDFVNFYIFSRGMKFENVFILIDGVSDMIKEMRYCWLVINNN